MTHPVNIIHLKKDTPSPYWDRGFLYGESVYDVIPFYQGKPYTLTQHFERFRRDVLLMKMPFTLDIQTFEKHVLKAIADIDASDGGIYVQVNSSNDGFRCAMPLGEEKSTVVITAFASPRPQLSALKAGIKLALFPESRGAYCHVKSTNRLPTRLAMLHAKEQGAMESIWYDATQGLIHEGCSSNIFFIHQDQLITPSLSPYIFQGIARETILQLAENLSIPVACRDVYTQELSSFDGAFITGSIKQLIPVNQLAHHRYAPCHSVWEKLFIAYNQYIDSQL